MRLYKRHSVYWMEWQRDGKQIRLSTNTRDRAVARSVASTMQIALAGVANRDAVEKMLNAVYGIESNPTRIPLDEAWEKYREAAHALGKDKISKHSMSNREKRFARLVKWLKKNAIHVRNIEDIKTYDCTQFVQFLAADMSLTEKTRKNIIGDLSTIWKTFQTVTDGLTNFWTNLSPKVEKQEFGKAFTHEQEKQIMEEAKRFDPEWFTACMIARHTGLRFGDVATLRWDDVNLETRIIHLTPNKTKKHRVVVTIPIATPLYDVLVGLAREGEYVMPKQAFIYHEYKKSYKKSFSFKTILQNCGITGKGYTFHSWRHTCATRLSEAGASIEIRKRILGHTQDSTAERYDHAVRLDDMRCALEATTQKETPSAQG